MGKIPFIFAFLLIRMSCSLMAQSAAPSKIPAVSWGMIQRIPEFESAYIGKRCVDILLPEEYPAYPNRHYPVLYMHDGAMLFDSSETWNHQEWGVDEALKKFSEKTGKACIVVAIHNAGSGRYAEYFPKKPFQSLDREGRLKVLRLAEKDPRRLMKDSMPVSDKYLDFLVKELKPMVDKSFRTIPGRAATWIAGSSMGGLISLYALCEYPEVFGAAACLSTHWPGIFEIQDNPVPESFFKYLKKNAPNPANHRIYMDCGNISLDSLYPALHNKAVAVLQAKGYGSKNLKAWIIPGANHSEAAWKARMPQVFEFFLSAGKR